MLLTERCLNESLPCLSLSLTPVVGIDDLYVPFLLLYKAKSSSSSSSSSSKGSVSAIFIRGDISEKVCVHMRLLISWTRSFSSPYRLAHPANPPCSTNLEKNMRSSRQAVRACLHILALLLFGCPPQRSTEFCRARRASHLTRKCRKGWGIKFHRGIKETCACNERLHSRIVRIFEWVREYVAQSSLRVCSGKWVYCPP